MPPKKLVMPKADPPLAEKGSWGEFRRTLASEKFAPKQKEEEISIWKETRRVFFRFNLLFLGILYNVTLVLSPIAGLKSYIPNKKGAAN